MPEPILLARRMGNGTTRFIGAIVDGLKAEVQRHVYRDGHPVEKNAAEAMEFESAAALKAWFKTKRKKGYKRIPVGLDRAA